jgi:hypothetical protein
MNRLRPVIWAQDGIIGIIETRREEAVKILENGVQTERERGQETRGAPGGAVVVFLRAFKPGIGFFFPLAVEAFPDDTTNPRVINGPSEVVFYLLDRKRAGVVVWDVSKSLSYQCIVPYGMKICKACQIKKTKIRLK